MALIGLVVTTGGIACGASVPPTFEPMEIPVGGVQPSIEQERAAARENIDGGLVEPSWLPDGFELVHVIAASYGHADLIYEDGESSIQTAQFDRGPYLPEPFDYGDRLPIGDTVEWSATPLNDFGVSGTSYSGTMPDGRIVHVHVVGLDPETTERILESLYVRAPGDD